MDRRQEEFKLESANAAFIHESFEVLPNYMKSLQKNFNSDVKKVDFKDKDTTTMIINKLVKKKTHDKIENLIDKEMINKDTRMILGNYNLSISGRNQLCNKYLLYQLLN